MNNPLISIVMPAYNSEKYIAKSIESVINQSYKEIELIIINDCSSDNTKNIIDNYHKKNNKIKVYTNSKNLGVAYSRNFGIEKATGEWIAFLDSDDVWKNDKLEKQVELLKKYNEEPILVYTGSSFIDDKDEKYGYEMQVPESVDFKELLKQNIISCSSVLVKKDIINSVKMDNDNAHEDFITWLRILKEYNTVAYGINEPLLIYRLSRNSKSGNKFKAAKMTYKVYKYVELNFFQRIYYMFHYIIRSIIKYKKIKYEKGEKL